MDRVYFIGIGGIGMSALARYFINEGKKVGGYDRISTALTKELESIGIDIHYEDSVELIDKDFLDKTRTIVVYTPAIASTHTELNYFLSNGFEVVKRSKMLGVLSAGKYVMAVSGTHGKTSTTTMLAHFNYCATQDKGSAFLGGISKNYGSNMILGGGERLAVEADEFDRSFLQLYPDIALVTSVDADHLDIYQNHNALKQGFTDFVSQIKSGGTLVYRYGIDLTIKNSDINTYTYSLDCNSDFRAENFALQSDGTYIFDIVCMDMVIKNCHLGIPGFINIENCVGAVAMMYCAGEMDIDLLKKAINSFKGVSRRFDFYINTPNLIYMDDYAHHPTELRATIQSVRAMFPNRNITAIFQPHLFSRTRDFAEDFARSLSLCDTVALLPIYPARELPIEGVTSDIILKDMTINDKQIIQKEDVLEFIDSKKIDILITFGAGDIDILCVPIYNHLKSKV